MKAGREHFVTSLYILELLWHALWACVVAQDTPLCVPIVLGSMFRNQHLVSGIVDCGPLPPTRTRRLPIKQWSRVFRASKTRTPFTTMASNNDESRNIAINVDVHEVDYSTVKGYCGIYVYIIIKKISKIIQEV